MKRLVLVALVAAAMAVAPKVAEAAIVIDFATGGTGFSGAILSSGGAITSGSGIAMGNVLLSGMVSNNGTWDTFGTGANSGSDTLRSLVNGAGQLNGSSVLSFNVAAGTFRIDGGIGCLDNTLLACTTVASTTPLVSGTLLSFVQGANSINFVGGNVVFASAFVNAFGLSAVPGWTVNSAFVINNAGQTVSSDVNITAVPEPGSMMLLGTGLLGLAAIARRRMRKS